MERLTTGTMNRAILISAAIMILAVSTVPAASGSVTGNMAGGYANYAITLSGNISETISFNIGSYSTLNHTYLVTESSVGGSTQNSVNSSDLYSAFPILNTNSTEIAVKQLARSPLNSYGYRGVIENNSSASFYGAGGERISLTAGVYSAVEFNDSAVYSENGAYISVSINCFIDASSGLVLELLMNIDDNGSTLSSFAQVTGSNVAREVVAGLNIPLIVAGSGIAVIAVLSAMILLRRKK